MIDILGFPNFTYYLNIVAQVRACRPSQVIYAEYNDPKRDRHITGRIVAFHPEIMSVSVEVDRIDDLR